VALAGAASAAVGVVAAFGSYGGGSAPGPASAVRVTNGVNLPGTAVGMNGDTLELIHSENHSTVGEGLKVTFQPTTSTAAPMITVRIPADRKGRLRLYGKGGKLREVDIQD
jgi:hypothetical protein